MQHFLDQVFRCLASLKLPTNRFPGVTAAGEPLPEELFSKLKAAKTYRSATMMLRQIHFSMVDLELHSRSVPCRGTVQRVGNGGNVESGLQRSAIVTVDSMWPRRGGGQLSKA